MPFKWSFYGLDKQIDVDEYIVGEWEDIFDCTLLINKYQNNEHEKFTVNNEKFQMIIYYQKKCKLSLFCIQYDDLITLNTVFTWFKESKGVIIWPLKFDTKLMLQILDSVTIADTESANNESNNENTTNFNDRWFETRIIFKNNKDYMLDKYSITISGNDCSKIYKRYNKINVSEVKLAPYEYCLYDYIYQQTGMQLQELPVRLMMLTNFLTINNEEIITQQLNHISFNHDGIIKAIYQQLQNIYSG